MDILTDIVKVINEYLWNYGLLFYFAVPDYILLFD